MGLDPLPPSTCVHLSLTPSPLRVDVINGWPCLFSVQPYFATGHTNSREHVLRKMHDCTFRSGLVKPKVLKKFLGFLDFCLFSVQPYFATGHTNSREHVLRKIHDCTFRSGLVKPKVLKKVFRFFRF